MAIIYVRSTDGNNADNGSTWALAKATLAGAAAIDAAGDTIYVSQVHSETTAATVSLNWAGTQALPTKIICANDGAEPPTAVAIAGAMAVTGAGNQIGLNTGSVYFYGLNFAVGTAANSGNMVLATVLWHRYEKCTFSNLGNQAAAFTTGGGSSTKILFESCDFKFATTAQLFQLAGGTAKFRGGSVLSGSAANVVMFDISSDGALHVEGFDFSNCAPAINLVKTTGGTAVVYQARFVDCKLPASWSGTPHSGTPNAMSVVEMINCSAGAMNYAYWRKVYAGDITHETTIVKSGGASDGTTPLSWKLVSNANAIYPLIGLESEDLYAWNDTVGSSVTATVEIVTDNVTLKNNEAYLELFYLSSTGTPIATRTSNKVADVLTTAANQSASTATWTTTGLTTPVKQKLAVTFTPQMKGYVIARVVLMKASTTMYADPVMTLS